MCGLTIYFPHKDVDCVLFKAQNVSKVELLNVVLWTQNET